MFAEFFAELEAEAKKDPLCGIEIVTSFKIKHSVIQGDYTPSQKYRLGWLTEQSRCSGVSRKAVTHAMADRLLSVGRAQRPPGQMLCGFKSAAKYGSGCDWEFLSGREITCPKCRNIVLQQSLAESIR